MGLTPTKLIILGNKLVECFKLTEEYDNCYHKDTCDNTCTQSDNCSYYKLTKALKLLGVD